MPRQICEDVTQDQRSIADQALIDHGNDRRTTAKQPDAPTRNTVHNESHNKDSDGLESGDDLFSGKSGIPSDDDLFDWPEPPTRDNDDDVKLAQSLQE